MSSKDTPVSSRSSTFARNQSDARSKLESVQTDCGLLQARNAFLEKELAMLRLAEEKRAVTLVEVLKHVDVIEQALHSLSPSEPSLISHGFHPEHHLPVKNGSKFRNNNRNNTHHPSADPESPVFRNKNRKFSLQHPNQLVRDENFVMPMTIPEWKESVNQTSPDNKVRGENIEDGASSKDQWVAQSMYSIKEVRRMLSDKDLRKHRASSAPHTPIRPAKSVLDVKRGSVIEKNHVDLVASTTDAVGSHWESKKSSKSKDHAAGKAPYEQANVFFCQIT